VGVDTVPKVVHETRKDDVFLVLSLNANWGVIRAAIMRILLIDVSKMYHHFLRNMRHTQGVRKASMNCTWKYIIQCAKLFYVSQSLKFGCVDKVPTIRAQVRFSMILGKSY
jgi:hypothetical protein